MNRKSLLCFAFFAFLVFTCLDQACSFTFPATYGGIRHFGLVLANQSGTTVCELDAGTEATLFEDGTLVYETEKIGISISGGVGGKPFSCEMTLTEQTETLTGTHDLQGSFTITLPDFRGKYDDETMTGTLINPSTTTELKLHRIGFYVSPHPLTVGKGEIGIIATPGGEGPYFLVTREGNALLFAQDAADDNFMSSKSGLWVAQANEGNSSTYYKVQDSSESELQVIAEIQTVEGAIAAVKNDLVLHFPFVEYQGNFFQVLMLPTLLRPLVWQVDKVAAREPYRGCSNPARVDPTSLDLEIPCLKLDLGEEISYYSCFMRIESVDPLEFKLVSARRLNLGDPYGSDFEQCFPQAQKMLMKYRPQSGNFQ